MKHVMVDVHVGIWGRGNQGDGQLIYGNLYIDKALDVVQGVTVDEAMCRQITVQTLEVCCSVNAMIPK